MFATQTRDLSHIELTCNGNISSLSVAKAYRVNGVDISTEKTRARVQGEKSLYSCSLSVCKSLDLAHFESNAMLAIYSKWNFSAKSITRNDPSSFFIVDYSTVNCTVQKAA